MTSIATKHKTKIIFKKMPYVGLLCGYPPCIHRGYYIKPGDLCTCFIWLSFDDHPNMSYMHIECYYDFLEKNGSDYVSENFEISYEDGVRAIIKIPIRAL